MQTLQTNSVNDLFINTSNSLTMLTGAAAVAAACKSACLGQLGEMVLETGKGLPNFQTIWIGTPDYAIWQSYLENTIMNVPDVTSVKSIKITAGNNKLNFVAEINTVYGPSIVNG